MNICRPQAGGECVAQIMVMKVFDPGPLHRRSETVEHLSPTPSSAIGFHMIKDEPIKRIPRPRADGQKTGLAGEFFVAAELLKRGLQTSLTLGNAKSIDLFAINDKGTQFTIQVKALRSVNYFLIDLERVQDACYYVFVVLNRPTVPPDYYV